MKQLNSKKSGSRHPNKETKCGELAYLHCFQICFTNMLNTQHVSRSGANEIKGVLFCFHGSPLENSYFIGSYPDVFIIQKRLTGRGVVAGWAWAGQDTLGSPVTLPDGVKNKTL